jgi:hypothetical protein
VASAADADAEIVTVADRLHPSKVSFPHSSRPWVSGKRTFLNSFLKHSGLISMDKQENKERKQYAHFLPQGVLVAPNVIETECRTIVAHHLNWPAIERPTLGVCAITALQCEMKSNCFKDY